MTVLAVNRVLPRPTEEVILASWGHWLNPQVVTAGSAADTIVPCRPVQRIVSRSTADAVRPLAGIMGRATGTDVIGNEVTSGPAENAIVSSAAADEILPQPSPENISSATSVDGLVVNSPEDDVVFGAAPEDPSAEAPTDDVAAATPEDVVLAPQARDDVTTCRAEKSIFSRRPNERGSLSSAGSDGSRDGRALHGSSERREREQNDRRDVNRRRCPPRDETEWHVPLATICCQPERALSEEITATDSPEVADGPEGALGEGVTPQRTTTPKRRVGRDVLSEMFLLERVVSRPDDGSAARLWHEDDDSAESSG